MILKPMNNDKKAKIFYLTTSIFVIVISYIVNSNLRETLPRNLSESIFWLTVPVFIFSIITLFTKNTAFQLWAKITNYLYIFFIFIILLTPTSTHGLDFLPIVKETVSIALAILYSIISLILILYKSFKKDNL